VSDPRPWLKDLSVEALRARFGQHGIAPYRAEQVAEWVYARGVEDPAAMTNLPGDLRDALAREWRWRALEVEAVERSRDGTTKARLVAGDGEILEAVLIPEERRTTLCVSTQVGCPLACSFCATGKLGLRRNLSTAEIVDQVLRMRELLAPGSALTNVVFMGMGEPLLNLAAVVEAVRLLLHPRAFGLAPRRVTVSTAGVVPRIRDLLEAVPVNLALSLHATSDAVRDVLVPLNRRFPLAVLREALEDLPRIGPRHPIFVEYTLLADVNDTPEDARRLARWLHGLHAKVNLIPFNPHPGSGYAAPGPAAIDRFLAELARRRLPVTLRRSRGDDIAAACGQLAARGTRPGPVKPTLPAAEDAPGGC